MRSDARREASDDLDRDVDAVVAACGGDAQAAIKSLLFTNHFLEIELAELRASASAGFVRQRKRKAGIDAPSKRRVE